MGVASALAADGDGEGNTVNLGSRPRSGLGFPAPDRAIGANSATRHPGAGRAVLDDIRLSRLPRVARKLTAMAVERPHSRKDSLETVDDEPPRMRVAAEVERRCTSRSTNEIRCRPRERLAEGCSQSCWTLGGHPVAFAPPILGLASETLLARPRGAWGGRWSRRPSAPFGADLSRSRRFSERSAALPLARCRRVPCHVPLSWMVTRIRKLTVWKAE
jgi:hypothetical protein